MMTSTKAEKVCGIVVIPRVMIAMSYVDHSFASADEG